MTSRRQNTVFITFALSFVVTFQSSLTCMILGFPAEVYGYGMKYSLILIGIGTSLIMENKSHSARFQGQMIKSMLN